MIYCLLGASGSGKSAISKVFEKFNIPEIISHTTRRRRVGESENAYHFISKEEFDTIEFIEKVAYSGNNYGLSKIEVDSKYYKSDCFVIVDRKGVEQLKSIYDDVVVIYIYTPVSILKERMLKRGDALKDVLDRLNYAVENNEFENFDIADYVIYNNKDLQSAKDTLGNIIKPIIYIDVDNTIINSTKRFIDIYNRINNTDYEWHNVYNYNFSPEIKVTKEEIRHIFNSDYFYKADYLFANIKSVIFMLKNMMKCNIKFVTIGNAVNMNNKCKFLNQEFPNIEIIGLIKDNSVMDKSVIKFKHNDIFIDDNEDNLITSNCRSENRILFCNDGEKEWNKNFRGLKADGWEDAYLIIERLLNNKKELS